MNEGLNCTLLSTSGMAAQNRKEFNLAELQYSKGKKQLWKMPPEIRPGKAIEKPEKGGKPEKTLGKTKEKSRRKQKISWKAVTPSLKY